MSLVDDRRAALRMPRLKVDGVACVAALALAALAALVADSHPRDGESLALALVAAISFPIVRSASLSTRSVALGTLIGTGELDSRLVGSASQALFLLVLLYAAPAPRRRSLAWIGWFVGLGLLAGSIVATADTAHVSADVILTLAAAAIATAWLFGVQRTGDTALPGLLVLQTAGLVGGCLVLVSFALGHPLVPSTSNELLNSRVLGGGTRGSGAWATPNEAGLVLSAAGLAALMRMISAPLRRTGLRWALSSFAMSSVGVILSGSRGSLLALIVGAAILGLPLLRRHRSIAVGLASGAIIGGILAVQLGTFAGRSLDLFAATDPSAMYRRHVQSIILQRVDWTQLHGFGFSVGNQLAKNAVAGSFGNIDEAWLYTVLCLGVLAIAGFGVLALTGLAVTARASLPFAGACLVWVLLSTLSENLLLDPGPSVAGFLLLAGAGPLVRSRIAAAQPSR